MKKIIHENEILKHKINNVRSIITKEDLIMH